LAGVWDLLDSLPRAVASPVVTASTIDRVALDVTGGRSTSPGPVAASTRPLRRWAIPAAAVAAALAGGIVAGRITAPDPDIQILQNLPLMQHLDLLREAGSVTFLEEMAKARYPLPPRMRNRQGADALQDEVEEFRGELAELAAALTAGGSAADRLETRRRTVQELPLEGRIELDRAADAFLKLSTAERRGIDAVAQALVDPRRPELRAALMLWHQWLASSRPEDRPEIVARGTDKRIEWLEWYSSRSDPRLEGRPNDRPPRGPDGRPRGPGPRGGRPEGGPPRGEGAERFPPRDGEPRPFRPAPPPREVFPGGAGETPPPPR
jgi:hypothetical protein